jgi:predicted HTH domain antitoxin
VRLYTALELFREHKLSLGKATQLAGLPREVFLGELYRRNIPVIDYNPEELEEELKGFSR